VYVVGGYVRDQIIGRKTTDIDLIVTRNARNYVQRLGGQLHVRWITLDEDFQIFRLLFQQKAPGTAYRYLDIAAMQGATLEHDLRRRDFTINALAREITANKLSPVIDVTHGIRDIRARKISFISEQGILDDPARLIRAFRFMAELSAAIDPVSLRLIRKHRRLIQTIAGERLRDELFKIFAAPRSGFVVDLMNSTGLLGMLFPSLDQCKKIARAYYPRGGVLRHCIDSLHRMDLIIGEIPALFKNLSPHINAYVAEQEGGFPCLVLLKFAALLHDIGKPAAAQKIKQRLRFFQHEDFSADIIRKTVAPRFALSRRESDFLQTAARAHMRPGNLAFAPVVTERALYRFFKEYGDAAVGILLVSLADRFTYLTNAQIARAHDKHYTTTMILLKRYFQANKPVIPLSLINGTILMRELGIPEGPLIGKILNAVQEAQAESVVTTRAQAISLARSLIKSFDT
jgi:tRNA nucleotidyltransferase/poly(A) polymerase